MSPAAPSIMPAARRPVREGLRSFPEVLVLRRGEVELVAGAIRASVAAVGRASVMRFR